jgi:hypothetical protein
MIPDVRRPLASRGASQEFRLDGAIMPIPREDTAPDAEHLIPRWLENAMQGTSERPTSIVSLRACLLRTTRGGPFAPVQLRRAGTLVPNLGGMAHALRHVAFGVFTVRVRTAADWRDGCGPDHSGVTSVCAVVIARSKIILDDLDLRACEKSLHSVVIVEDQIVADKDVRRPNWRTVEGGSVGKKKAVYKRSAGMSTVLVGLNGCDVGCLQNVEKLLE